jgi:hypothetical protein
MRNDWILDVLTDLKAFAQANGLSALAEQLEDTALVAAAEIASKGEGPTVDAQLEADKTRTDTGGVGTGI